MIENNLAFIGLPQTGKSTYLGALWQLIQDSGDGSVTEVDVTGDRSYLQSLGERVASAQEIERTPVDSDQGMRLTLRFRDLGDLSLEIPDLSGELFRQLIENRIWHTKLDEAVERADGLILFLHPHHLTQPFSIRAVNQLLGVVAVDDTEEPRAFSVHEACTAAQHLDALENVLAAVRPRPVRLGVVVSAWDVVDGQPTPLEWLRRRLPALASYLSANEQLTTSSIFGVSAQGGALPEQQEELLAQGNVIERAFAVGPDGIAVGLAEPLRWVIWG